MRRLLVVALLVLGFLALPGSVSAHAPSQYPCAGPGYDVWYNDGLWNYDSYRYTSQYLGSGEVRVMAHYRQSPWPWDWRGYYYQHDYEKWCPY